MSPYLFNLYAEYIIGNAGLNYSHTEIKITLRYAHDIILKAESKEELKSLLMKVKEKNAKAGLKFSIQKTKIMASGPVTSWQTDGGGGMETVADFTSWTPKSWQTVTAAMKLKDACSLYESYDKSRQCIKKQRHHFADKVSYTQSYDFSSGHV